MRIRVGTRSSRLARVQTDQVVLTLERMGHGVEVVEINTAGDRHRHRTFARVGAHGVFVREIEIALLEERIDVAVHSCKDLPGGNPEGLVIAAVPGRVHPADRLLVRSEAADAGAPVLPLRAGARVGTASERRRSLLLHLRPDLEIAFLRGNLPTRIDRLCEGRHDAILLASAGIERLDGAAAAGLCPRLRRDGIVETNLDPSVFVPAPSQGALAVQIREKDEDTYSAVIPLDDPEAHLAVRTERALLAKVQGGCQVPFGAWCRPTPDGGLEMTAVLETGGCLVRASSRGRDPEALVEDTWRRLQEGR